MQESTDNDNDVSDKKTTQGELSDSDSDNEEIVCSFEKLSVFIWAFLNDFTYKYNTMFKYKYTYCYGDKILSFCGVYSFLFFNRHN